MILNKMNIISSALLKRCIDQIWGKYMKKKIWSDIFCWGKSKVKSYFFIHIIIFWQAEKSMQAILNSELAWPKDRKREIHTARMQERAGEQNHFHFCCFMAFWFSMANGYGYILYCFFFLSLVISSATNSFCLSLYLAMVCCCVVVCLSVSV